MSELREYGVTTTFNFPLVEYGFTDFKKESPAIYAVGDAQIKKDATAFGNTSNGFAHEGNGVYSLELTAAEMQAAKITVTVIDQSVSKEWEDQAIVIETYGHASAQHTLAAVADAVLGRNLASVTGAAARSLLNAVRFLRNKWHVVGTTLTVYEENGASPAWTSAVTTSLSGNVTGMKPT